MTSQARPEHLRLRRTKSHRGEVYVPQALFEEVLALAVERRCSLSSIVRMALAERLQNGREGAASMQGDDA